MTQSVALFEYRIPAFLLEIAELPIGPIPVRLGQLELAKTTVNAEGNTSFYLPLEVHHKLQLREYKIRTVHYHWDETNSDAPSRAKIVSLVIAPPPSRFPRPK